MKRSALVRYLYYNIQLHRLQRYFRFKFARGNNNNVNNHQPLIDPVTINSEMDPVRIITHYTLSTIISENTDKKCLILMDGQRKDLYDPDSKRSEFHELNDMVYEVTDSIKVPFIDLRTVFENDFRKLSNREKTKKHATYIQDKHWDASDHLLVSDTLSSAIMHLLKEK